MQKKHTSLGIQLLEAMMSREYLNTTIETTVGTVVLYRKDPKLIKELLKFIEDGHSEKEFWKLIQTKLNQIV